MKEVYGVRFNINGKGLYFRDYSEKRQKDVLAFPLNGMDLSKVEEIIGHKYPLYGEVTADNLEIVLLKGEAPPLNKWREIVFKECEIVNVRKWSELEKYANDTGKSLNEVDLFSFLLGEN